MNAARKLARIKHAAAGIPIVLVAFGPALLSKFLPIPRQLLAVGVFALLVATMINCFYFLFFWQPRCPHCKVARARFTRIDNDEYLICPSCGYEEKTGWTYD